MRKLRFREVIKPTEDEGMKFKPKCDLLWSPFTLCPFTLLSIVPGHLSTGGGLLACFKSFNNVVVFPVG